MIHLALTRVALATLLLGLAGVLPLAPGVAPPATHAAGGPTPLQAGILGYWHNPDPHTRGVTLIHVHYDPFWREDFVATWAKCFPKDCYWGTERITWVGSTAEANYVLEPFVSINDSLTVWRVGSHLDGADLFLPPLGDPRPERMTHLTLVPGV